MWYDAFIFILLAFCTVRGASKGFAWQIATIGAIILCFLFAETGSLAIAPLIQLDPPLDRWVAMFILYIGASFASFAVARSVRKTLEKWQFVEYDSHLGAIFGFLKGGAIALVITFFAVTLSETTRAEVLASYSGLSAGRILSAIHPVMPRELHAVIDPYLENLGQPVVHHDTDHPSDSDFGLRPPLSRPSQTHGGQGHPSTEDFGPAPLWPHEPAPTKTPATSPSEDLRRLVRDVPEDLKQAALTALQNTQPEDRDELIAAFRTAIPGFIKAISAEWKQGRPADADRLSWRDKTLREIAGVYTLDLSAQRDIIRQAEEALRGVPDHVADVVIQDWYADLLRLTAEDPDPETNLSTRLDVRIRRQLAAFGVSPDTLSADLRTRLGWPRQ